MTKSKNIYAKRGKKGEGSTQKSMHLFLDADLIEVVDKQPNKNRFINDCIREHEMSKA
jgi:hypothetical protein